MANTAEAAQQPWNLSHSLEVSQEPIPYVIATHEIGEESNLPLVEQSGNFVLTPQTSVAIYDEPLGKADCPPVVISMSHAGELVPQDMWDRTSPAQRFVYGSEVGLDVGTISLFEPRGYLGVRARVSRVIVDLNRAPDDDGKNHPSGKGVMWLEDFEGNSTFSQEPDSELIRRQVDKYYGPYVGVLQTLAGTLIDRGHQNVLYVDGHSYLSHIAQPSYGIAENTPMPLFILGSREGKPGGPSVHPKLLQVFAETLTTELPDDVLSHHAVSQKVGLNDPFRGVINLERWGGIHGIYMPATGVDTNPIVLPRQVQAIQVETNNTAFFHNGKYDHDMLGVMRQAIDRAIANTTDAMLSLPR